MNNRRPLLAWMWALLVLVGTVIIVAQDPGSVRDAGEAIVIAMPTAVAALGAVIATRRPGNRIAWIMSLVAGIILEPVAELRLARGTPDPVTMLDVLAIAGRNSVFFVFLVIPVSLLLHLFPTGRFLNSRWSWAGWVAGIAILSLLSNVVFSTEIGVEDPVAFTVINPIGFIDSTVSGALRFVFGLGMLSLMIGGIVAVVVRYRRSDHAVRSQIKWVGLSLILFAVALVYRLLTGDRGVVSGWIFDASTGLIPVSITLAMTRYRLYDIDRLISRTVGYFLVVAVLALVYVTGAVWLPTRLIGEQSPLFVAVSTLAAAALFNPARKRIITWVDRRFNRTRYDAQHVIDESIEGLKDEVDVDKVAADSISVIAKTMQPESVGIWIRP